MSRVSTHVLDLASGRPARGIQVRLERRCGTTTQLISTKRTDEGGRCRELTPGRLEPGIYELKFEVAEYFAGNGVNSLYPYISVAFQIAAGEADYHLPLLLSPNGFTTYRGS